MHVSELLMQELQSLEVEQKQTLDNNTDRIVELEKPLNSLQNHS